MANFVAGVPGSRVLIVGRAPAIVIVFHNMTDIITGVLEYMATCSYQFTSFATWPN